MKVQLIETTTITGEISPEHVALMFPGRTVESVVEQINGGNAWLVGEAENYLNTHAVRVHSQTKVTGVIVTEDSGSVTAVFPAEDVYAEQSAETDTGDGDSNATPVAA